MRNLIRLTDYSLEDINEIFEIADAINAGKYTEQPLRGKTVVMFFPESSIRTRVTFEKGIHLLGGQTILFSPETLNKKEALTDVIGYLNNWADLLVVRYKDIAIVEKIAKYSKVPVINALTDVNHPCEMISDLYALSKLRENVLNDKFLFCGVRGNIGFAWKETAETIGFQLEQCCPPGYEMEGVVSHNNINDAIVGKDIICTDSLPQDVLKDFEGFQITKEIMDKANKGAILNPCPPFYLDSRQHITMQAG